MVAIRCYEGLKVIIANMRIFLQVIILISIFYRVRSVLLSRESIGYENEYDLSLLPSIEVRLVTSMAYLADTSDKVRMTFIGNIASSSSFSIGPLSHGYFSTNISLDKVIGALRGVSIDKPGHDEWLMSRLDCILDGTYYELSNPKQWLNNYQLEYDMEYGDGYVPFVSDDLPAAASLRLEVVNNYPWFNADGTQRLRN
jgi:hypothetical protein